MPSLVHLRRGALLLAGALLFAQSSPDLTVHIEVNLVQVDAVVTDARNQPVTGLNASDFEILQDGKPQPIKNFSWIDTRDGGIRAGNAKPAAGAPLLPPAHLKPSDVRRTFAIMVDDLGMSWESFPAVKHSLQAFVEYEKQPNDLVAILQTGGGMGIYRQFTTDPRLLGASIDHLRYNLTFSRLGLESFASLGPLQRPIPWEATAGSRYGTVRALRSTIRGLSRLPGRKVLILYSEALSMVEDNFVQEIGDEAERASVVIYGIDPRGLPTLELTAADDTSWLPVGRNSALITRVTNRRASEYFQSQGGLVYLSNQTGGLFFRDNNDLDRDVAAVSADAAGYYLIGYQPASTTFDAAARQPVFHKLEVRVKRKGVHVRSRAGFFSVPSQPEDPSRVLLRLQSRQGQIENAFESPFSADSIHTRLTGLFVDTANGAWIEGMVHIDATDLKFSEEPDGMRAAEVEIVSMLDGEHQQKPAFRSNTVTMRFTPDTYRNAEKSGVTCKFFRPAGAPGSWELKIVVRDSHSGEIGSASQFLDVPDLSRKELALSGIMMGEVSGTVPATPEQALAPSVPEHDAGSDPAVRVFQRGSTVRFGYQILNARANPRNQPEVMLQTRLFHNGAQVYASTPAPFEPADEKDVAQLEVEKGLSLGAQLEPGEYALQVMATDKLASGKNSTASQTTDFEIRP